MDYGNTRNEPTGVRFTTERHLADKLYRGVVTKLIEGLSRYDFDVQVFARNLMVHSSTVIRGRIMQLAIALIDAGAQEYDCGDMSHGPMQAKRLQETVDLYEMPRG